VFFKTARLVALAVIVVAVTQVFGQAPGRTRAPRLWTDAALADWALPIAGVDGTLSTRMRGTPAEKNLRAKTGSLSSVASLSGYVTTAAGDHLVFSMMLNNYPDAAAVRRDSIDAIAVLLASYNGKT